MFMKRAGRPSIARTIWKLRLPFHRIVELLLFMSICKIVVPSSTVWKAPPISDLTPKLLPRATKKRNADFRCALSESWIRQPSRIWKMSLISRTSNSIEKTISPSKTTSIFQTTSRPRSKKLYQCQEKKCQAPPEGSRRFKSRTTTLFRLGSQEARCPWATFCRSENAAFSNSRKTTRIVVPLKLKYLFHQLVGRAP